MEDSMPNILKEIKVVLDADIERGFAKSLWAETRHLASNVLAWLAREFSC
jgi:hypothetical protein